jgi:hypothetical protein
MFLQLRAEQIRAVSVETAHAAVGTTAQRRAPGVFDAWRGGPPLLLDVRSADAFSQARPAGAVSAPCYPELRDPLNEMDWACVMGFGRLPDHDGRFVAQVDRLVGGNKVRRERCGRQMQVGAVVADERARRIGRRKRPSMSSARRAARWRRRRSARRALRVIAGCSSWQLTCQHSVVCLRRSARRCCRRLCSASTAP